MQNKDIVRRPKGCWRSRLSSGFSLTVIGMLLLLWTLPVEAGNPNFRLCFRQAINVPGPNFGQPPVVDGIINNDLGWTGAFRYVFGNGTPTADTVVQGIRDANNLYLSFEVNNDQQFNDQDAIVLTIDPDPMATNPANDHRIHIYPVFNAGAAGSGKPRETDYWTNSSTWNTGAAPVALPDGVVIKVTSVGVAPPGPVAWLVEVQLPRTAFSIPAAGDFGLYFNVIRVSAVGIPIGTASEKFWPTDASTIGQFLDTNTPPPNTWGNGTLTGPCNGVNIAASDITTNNVPTSKISFPPGSNIFTATVQNNTVDGAGNPIAANQVGATFRIANFGIPAFGDWTPVPTGNNPTPPGNIAANGSLALSTSAWTLTPTQVTQYTPNFHQCILAELDSTDPNTVFVNKSAWRNMDFGPGSIFERVAEISAKGYGKPPQGAHSHQFDLYVTTREEIRWREKEKQVDEREQAELRKRAEVEMTPDLLKLLKQIDSQLTWVVHGCRRTGNFITIKNKKFEICDAVGAYGYIIQHDGFVLKWKQDLGDLKPLTNTRNVYSLSIVPEKVATVTTRIEPVEPQLQPPRKCGPLSLAGAFTLLTGMLALGIVVYRSKKK